MAPVATSLIVVNKKIAYFSTIILMQRKSFACGELSMLLLIRPLQLTFALLATLTSSWPSKGHHEIIGCRHIIKSISALATMLTITKTLCAMEIFLEVKKRPANSCLNVIIAVGMSTLFQNKATEETRTSMSHILK